jgi:hypothetical protein
LALLVMRRAFAAVPVLVTLARFVAPPGVLLVA